MARVARVADDPGRAAHDPRASSRGRCSRSPWAPGPRSGGPPRRKRLPRWTAPRVSKRSGGAGIRGDARTPPRAARPARARSVGWRGPRRSPSTSSTSRIKHVARICQQTERVKPPAHLDHDQSGRGRTPGCARSAGSHASAPARARCAAPSRRPAAAGAVRRAPRATRSSPAGRVPLRRWPERAFRPGVPRPLADRRSNGIGSSCRVALSSLSSSRQRSPKRVQIRAQVRVELRVRAAGGAGPRPSPPATGAPTSSGSAAATRAIALTRRAGSALIMPAAAAEQVVVQGRPWSSPSGCRVCPAAPRRSWSKNR